MPITNDRKGRYPSNWRVISDQIRTRAKDCCEKCGVRNYAFIRRLADGSRVEANGQHCDRTGKPLPTASAAEMATAKPATVRCACAHVHDHNPENCAPDNLAWWCQQCHNAHDMEMRAKHISATKRKGKKKS